MDCLAEHKPKMLNVGFSSFLGFVDFPSDKQKCLSENIKNSAILYKIKQLPYCRIICRIVYRSF